MLNKLKRGKGKKNILYIFICAFQLQLSFSKFIDVGETLRYVPHPNDKNKTLLKQEAIVTVQGAPLASYMEDLLTKKISFNAGMVSFMYN